MSWKLYGEKKSQIVLGMDNQIETKEIRGRRVSVMGIVILNGRGVMLGIISHGLLIKNGVTGVETAGLI